MGWYAPELKAYGRGERAFCNADEDALTMAVEASRRCLEGMDTRLRGLYLASTSLPFLDRMNAGILKTALQLEDEVRAADFTASQRAGTAALIAALEAVRDDTGSFLVAASDRRLASSGSPEELWAGDGAAAVTLGARDEIATFLGAHTLTRDFPGHYRTECRGVDYIWEERWIRQVGYPIIPEVVRGLLDKLSMGPEDVTHLAFPCFSPAEHRKIGERLGMSDRIADPLLETVGETGTAHPLVLLAHTLERARPGEVIIVVGFGSGADAVAFRVTERIGGLPARRAVESSLRRKSVETNYARFLKYRGMLIAEEGIRREAPQRTALSVLHRHRDLLTGLVGGRCDACGTPQFPDGRVCVNPDCRRVDSQRPYAFAHRTARIRTFTADYLGPSANPPNLYGMVQFDGGGRMLAEFTDCALEDLAVGGAVRMAFRKRYDDGARGFPGYFWKAVPCRGEEG